MDLATGTVTIGRGIVMGPEGLVEKDTKTHSVRTVSLEATTVDFAASAPFARRGGMAAARRALPPAAHVFSKRTRRVGAVAPGFDHACLPFAVPASGPRRRAAPRPAPLRGDAPARLRRRRSHGRRPPRPPQRRDATLNVYSHFLPEADRRAADVLGKLLDDAVTANTGGPSEAARE